MANITLNKACRICGISPNTFYPSKVRRKDYICVSCAKKETYRNRWKRQYQGYIDEAKYYIGEYLW